MASSPEPHPVPEAESGAAAPKDDAPTRLDQWKMTPWRLLSHSERGATFEEVIQGFDADSVLVEAQGCLLCKHPTCISGCPNNNPIPTYIGLVQEGRILEAAVADYEKNSLAACTGRVCNWEAQCEGNCVLNTRGEGVRIGAIERYIADYALRHKDEFDALMAQRAAERAVRGSSAYTAAEISPFAAAVTAYGNASPEAYVPPYGIPDDTPLAGHTVGVVGAGPAGLACADYLSRRGCAVVVFEAQKYSGGLLADGIPEFVLPEDTVEGEVARLRDQDVVFCFETVLGSDMSLDDLRREFDAVFLGIGATTARRTGVAGEDAEGVWTAQEFLSRYLSADTPRRVVFWSVAAGSVLACGLVQILGGAAGRPIGTSGGAVAILRAAMGPLAAPGLAIVVLGCLGRDLFLAGLRREFDAVFLGIGATTARRTGVERTDSKNIGPSDGGYVSGQWAGAGGLARNRPDRGAAHRPLSAQHALRLPSHGPR